MTAVLTPLRQRARLEAITAALSTVMDPELDEPITDLGFVRSVVVPEGPDNGTVVVHLRLPTSFCSPNFAYLMASDAKDAISGLEWVSRVVVQLDDHHDSHLINAGLAADAGYLGTFGHEAEASLDELRDTFRRKAHTAAMERCLTSVLRADPRLVEADLCALTLADLPVGPFTDALRKRRAAIGLPDDRNALVFVDDEGRACSPDQAALRLRRARSTRISVDGNAHFCRGLLVTRYPDSGRDQAPRVHDNHPLIPLKVI
ncbi:Metal-sulfur cluster biosynthetic enzyme [Nakamurella panacisegetis]|uniref:Metal-sulfur cluster biosynthetic enzyme n=1 Tax=Nakamurella panacisegetis TaxID=1090615 RepID=A0A1H0M1Y5_9ACTN|nr:iron-sulfur cluster assembly protein [Nakamurella panacisegetis]SDO74458.1 Metal-sulfur cluster biosynthetic enzyme [Nakamurella panacisegetis]